MTSVCDDILKQTETFILAGGKGERLQPLTSSLPKPAVSFGGVFRIVDFTLSNCWRSGLTRIGVLTQHRYGDIHSYIEQNWSERWSTRTSKSLMCLPPTPKDPYCGTADAVFKNREILLSGASKYVVILSGDHVYDMDYRELLKRHVQTDADVSVAAVEYPIREATNFGVLVVDAMFRVRSFQEKPAAPRPLPGDPSKALVSMGVYVFKTDALLRALQDQCGSAGRHDFGHHIIPAMVRNARAFAYDFRDTERNRPGYWRDIGTLDSYYAASMDLVRDNPSFIPHVESVSPQKLRARVRTSAKVAHSVLSPHVSIGESAWVRESVLLPGVQVGNGALLRRTIVAENVRIPNGYRAGWNLRRDRERHLVTAGGVVVIAETPKMNAAVRAFTPAASIQLAEVSACA